MRSGYKRVDVTNHTPYLITIMLLILALPTADAQSVYWGVQVGDEITYVLQRKYMDPMFEGQVGETAFFVTKLDEGQTLIARVDFLDDIPSAVNLSQDVPQSISTLIRQNDSEVIGENITLVAIPVGLWDIPRPPTNDSPDDGHFTHTTIDTSEEWGSVVTGDFWYLIFHMTFYMQTIYSKADGALNVIQVQVDVSGNDLMDIKLARWAPGVPTIVPGDPQFLTIALVAGGVALVVIVVLIYHRRRSS